MCDSQLGQEVEPNKHTPTGNDEILSITVNLRSVTGHKSDPYGSVDKSCPKEPKSFPHVNSLDLIYTLTSHKYKLLVKK